MTLHGELVDSVKWMLCDFYAAQPPLGDSNVEYDFAEKIVASVREQIAQDIENGSFCWRNDSTLDELAQLIVKDSANIARGK